jgi:hypothetical protein
MLDMAEIEDQLEVNEGPHRHRPAMMQRLNKDCS